MSDLCEPVKLVGSQISHKFLNDRNYWFRRSYFLFIFIIGSDIVQNTFDQMSGTPRRQAKMEAV